MNLMGYGDGIEAVDTCGVCGILWWETLLFPQLKKRAEAAGWISTNLTGEGTSTF